MLTGMQINEPSSCATTLLGRRSVFLGYIIFQKLQASFTMEKSCK